MITTTEDPEFANSIVHFGKDDTVTVKGHCDGVIRPFIQECLKKQEFCPLYTPSGEEALINPFTIREVTPQPSYEPFVG